MPKLLQIHSSPNLGSSITRELSDRFVKTWIESHANVDVETLDLAVDEVPHFDPLIMQAAMAAGGELSPEMTERLAVSDRLIDQLEAAELLVIGAPMINFTIPSQLKAWFDNVMIAGRTFKYTAPGVSKGLLFGKKAFVVLARGGDYTDGPAAAFDFQEPLLRTLLGFIGIFDVTFIRAEGLRQRPEDAAAIIGNAHAVIARLAA